MWMCVCVWCLFDRSKSLFQKIIHFTLKCFCLSLSLSPFLTLCISLNPQETLNICDSVSLQRSRRKNRVFRISNKCNFRRICCQHVANRLCGTFYTFHPVFVFFFPANIIALCWHPKITNSRWKLSYMYMSLIDETCIHITTQTTLRLCVCV